MTELLGRLAFGWLSNLCFWVGPSAPLPLVEDEGLVGVAQDDETCGGPVETDPPSTPVG